MGTSLNKSKALTLGMLILLPALAYADLEEDLADQPLFLGGGVGVPGNMVLVPSVEFPTVESVANQGSYSPDRTFVGYFDPGKCYKYSYSSKESERHFYPVNTSGPECPGDEWSGNYLNWATTPTIDPFRKALTGGYRVKDTPSETWLEKAYSRQGTFENFPMREISSNVNDATPFSTRQDFHTRILRLGNKMWFRVNYKPVQDNVEDYDPATSDKSRNGSFEVSVRVEVCDPSVGVEDNCKEYDSGWKPEGLIQQNAERLRYSVIGYLSDSNFNERNQLRDGGVLRARQKYVGPEKLEEGSGFVDNPKKEWDPDTGQLINNPNPTDARNTPSDIDHSGVISYINKFGQLKDDGNKVYDPVSELYYVATRYLKNQGNVGAYSAMNGSEKEELADGFPVIEDWDDPIAYECQANVVLGIGDTNTSRDKNLPGSPYANWAGEPERPSEIRNDDTVDVVDETNRVGAMQGIGDIGSDSTFNSTSNSAYIAGLAYHNLTRDMRSDLDGMQTAETHWVDVLEFEKLKEPAKNQYYLAAKFGGFTVPEGEDFDPETRTEDLPEDWWYTNGEEVRDPETNKLYKRPDNFYTAGDASSMVSSLEDAFASVLAGMEGSSTGVTFNTATLETDTLLFGARFDSGDWSGQLFAKGLTDNPSGPPTIDAGVEWEAGAVLDERDLDDNPRQIMTYRRDSSESVVFAWDNLTADQKADLLAGGLTEDQAKDRLAYLRGESFDDMRDRGSRLGDIVNSTPVYVQSPSLGWPNEGEFGVEGDRYAQFREEQNGRRSAVYVGANDGMFHGFAAGEDEGNELFSYIPSFVYSDTEDQGLHYLTQEEYEHRYYVDLTPVVSDVYMEGADGAAADWRTIVIGGARAGARGIFALDVTEPDTVSEGEAQDLALWEFTSDDDARMGYITEPPVVGMAKWGNNDYRWTAFFGNGFNSGSGKTGFFMLDLEGGLDGDWNEGDDYRFVEFDDAGGGLAPLRAVDLDGDRIIDRLYGGDLDGNMWVATPKNNGTWESVYGNDPLFTANNNQPITTAPRVVRNPEDGGGAPNLIVLFGTGQYLTPDDPISTDTQSFYGIFEQGDSGLTPSNLVSRTLSESAVTVDGVTYTVREADGDDMNASQSGWYVDFTTDEGERIIQSPQVRGDYAFVNSVVPSQDLCSSGGDGWLMAFGLDGKTPEDPVFSRFEDPVVGYRTEGGMPDQSGFLGDYMLTPRSDGEIVTDELELGRDEENLGRVGWQELIQ